MQQFPELVDVPEQCKMKEILSGIISLAVYEIDVVQLKTLGTR